MREFGLERAALVGNYFGYQIIADQAVHHPERVERAMLQGPTMDCGRGPVYRRTNFDKLISLLVLARRFYIHPLGEYIK